MAGMDVTPAHEIVSADIGLLGRIVLLRLEDSDAERRRVESVRELLWAAGELNRALATHTRHALVDHYGTPGTADLDADSAALSASLQRYLASVRAVTAEFGGTAECGRQSGKNVQ